MRAESFRPIPAHAGTPVILEEGEARRLYQQIAEAYQWSHDEFCEECGCVLVGDTCPEGCED